MTGFEAKTLEAPIVLFLTQVFLDVNWNLLLNIDRMRNRDGFRDVDRIGFWYMDGNLNRDGHIYRDLHRIGNFLLNWIGDLLLYIYRIRFGNLNRIRFLNFDLHGDLYGVWNLLDDLDGIWLWDGHFDLLGDDDSLDVVVAVLYTGNTPEVVATISKFLQSSLLLFCFLLFCEHQAQDKGGKHLKG